jgi:hypothetical protein
MKKIKRLRSVSLATKDGLKKIKPKILTGNYATVAPIDHKLLASLYNYLPRVRVLERLATLQVPFPAELPPVRSENAFPLDVTVIGDGNLRQLASYWTAQFARVNALLGLARGEHKRLDRKVSREKQILFVMYAPDRKSTAFLDKVKGQIQKNKRISLLERKLDEIIAAEESLETLARDFKAYVEILESETTWRMSERKMIRAGG